MTICYVSSRADVAYFSVPKLDFVLNRVHILILFMTFHILLNVKLNYV